MRRKRIPLILVGALLFVLLESGTIVFWMVRASRRHSVVSESRIHAERSLRIGIIPGGISRKNAQETWNRFLTNFEKRNQTCLVPYFSESRQEIINGFRNNVLDLIYINPATYLELKKQTGITAVACQYDENSDNYCVLTVPSSGPEFIEETRGKRVTFTNSYSITGYIAPLVFFRKKLNCDPAAWFSSIAFSGSDVLSIEDLLAGKTDMIAVNYHVLKEFFKNSKTDDDKVKILWVFRKLPPNVLCINPALGQEKIDALKAALICDVSDYRESENKDVFFIPINYKFERELEEFAHFLEK